MYANQGLERLTGFNSDQINQADWRSLLLEEDRAVASPLGKGPWQPELRIACRFACEGAMAPPEWVELIAFGHKAGDSTELWLFTGLEVSGVAAQKRPEFEAQLQATLKEFRCVPEDARLMPCSYQIF